MRKGATMACRRRTMPAAAASPPSRLPQGVDGRARRRRCKGAIPTPGVGCGSDERNDAPCMNKRVILVEFKECDGCSPSAASIPSPLSKPPLADRTVPSTPVRGTAQHEQCPTRARGRRTLIDGRSFRSISAAPAGRGQRRIAGPTVKSQGPGAHDRFGNQRPHLHEIHLSLVPHHAAATSEAPAAGSVPIGTCSRGLYPSSNGDGPLRLLAFQRPRRRRQGDPNGAPPAPSAVLRMRTPILRFLGSIDLIERKRS
jgi:hypothetical protein